MKQPFILKKRLTWEAAKKEAIKAKRTFRYGDSASLRIVAQRIKNLAEFSMMTIEEIIAFNPNLTKCQRMVGVENGFKSFESMFRWLKANNNHSKYIRIWNLRMREKEFEEGSGTSQKYQNQIN